MPHARGPRPAKPIATSVRRPWSTRVRSRVVARQDVPRTPATDPAPAQAQLRQGALHSLAWVSQQLAGLTPSGGETVMPSNQAMELVVEVEFAGFRTGRVTLAFGRGLTRQIGSNMSHMANLDGRQLNALEAAKEMASATTAELLQAAFGVEAQFRISQAQSMPPRPLTGELQLAIGFAEGTLAVSVEVGQASARHAG